MNETFMAREIRETASVVARHETHNDIAVFGEALRNAPPELLLTIARGTSDHAAEYLGYLLMRYCGIPALSVPLSLNTIYHTRWQLRNALALTISQSGGSPDLIDSINNLHAAGLNSVALVNTIPSPLAEASNHVLDIAAGVEHSVAATKSFVATLSVGLRAFNYLFDDPQLTEAFKTLPEKLDAACALDWSKAVDTLAEVDRLYVIGRGAGLAIAKEAALKCKETCLIQGEAFSGAEVKHGPMALMNPKQVVLIFAPPDDSQAGLIETARQFREMGAKVLLAADDSVSERDLPLIDAGHPALQGLTSIQSFYMMVEELSAVRGINTDQPPNLKKRTETR
ncbi:SIS domain-containing protein [Suttonella sp. R2A3]|uniref:SIS domain-containing protein n=1 Tax=Suttonella sp. R2A3 TaxID=2908648 RepID=UPI001F1FD89C|nr:SIS domain-containing protein [Suttonella sp. R2A3]UJF24492.1 SIS domain-containing protein [Suttonella sp. R2A3]